MEIYVREQPRTIAMPRPTALSELIAGVTSVGTIASRYPSHQCIVASRIATLWAHTQILDAPIHADIVCAMKILRRAQRLYSVFVADSCIRVHFVDLL